MDLEYVHAFYDTEVILNTIATNNLHININNFLSEMYQ